MEDKKTFGEYVLKKRKEMGLTQKQFAEKLFVTESAVSKWERGLSYPDITLVGDICKVFNISEHELLTASEDAEDRSIKEIAQKHIRMVNLYKNIMIVIYSISLVVCFICNIAIQHTLSWFFIVLASVMIAVSLTLVPVLISKKKWLVTIGAFTISLSMLLLTCNIYTKGGWFFIAFAAVLFGITLVFLPFILYNEWLPKYLADKKTLIYFVIETLMLFVLLIVCNLYSGGGWFLKTALPITMFCLGLPWSMMLIIRYTKVNYYLKTAVCFTLIGIFQYSVNWVINIILGDDLYDFVYRFDFSIWNEKTIDGNIKSIIFFIFISLAVVFAFMGISMKTNQFKNIENN